MRRTFGKQIIVVIAIVFLMVVTAIAMIAKNKENDTNKNENEEIEIYSQKITISTKDYVNKNSSYDVEMKIPQFVNLEDPFKSTINKRIDADLNYQNVFNAVSMGIEDKSTIGKFKYYVTYDRYDCYDYISLVIHQNIQLRR